MSKIERARGAAAAWAALLLASVAAGQAMLADRLDRARADSDRGASAVEWAIIAGAVCVLAAIVYAAVNAAVTSHVSSIK